MSTPVERQDWEHHWHALGGERSLFGVLASAVRKVLLSRAVHHYTERSFAEQGIFVEAGCGTSESSRRIRRHGRKLVGLDFSLEALRQARQERTFDSLVCGDIRRLPFRQDSLAGIWNLGVMEHFHAPQGQAILREFRRVLRGGHGTLLLFWPPTFGLSRWVLAPFEWLRSRSTGREFRFFPDEVHRLPSRGAVRELLAAADLETLQVDFTPRDGFNHLIVIARKALG
jgi:SAM-dependent methyltransferase